MAFEKHDNFLFRIGFGGVDPAESIKAKRWGKRLEWPMLFLALWIMVDWYIRSQNLGSALSHLFTDWLIWLGFVAELAIMLLVVEDRKRYLRQNWMSLVIIVGGLPAIWGAHAFYAGAIRMLRLMVVVGILFKVSRDLRSILARHNLGTTLIICFVFLIISGLVISTLDPAFNTPWDGIWWAWVTITTVGYGDIVPATNEGRLFGAILILIGLCMFSLLTASFSVFFIEKDEGEIARKEQQNLERIHHLENRLERIEMKLEQALTLLESAQATSNTQPTEQDNRTKGD